MAVPKIESGKLFALCGRSRSGKTQKALDLIKKHKCVLVWDVEEQYQVTHRARSQKQLLTYIEQCAGKKAVIGFTANLSDFNYFCKVAFWYVRKCGELGKKSAVVFEETADVTSPGKAPEYYGILLRRGLKYGCDLFAITQRPAESDKTAVGNASMIHICTMNLPRDRRYMAEMTGVPLQAIAAMKADQERGSFDYISVDTNRGDYVDGVLTFPKGKPKFKDLGSRIAL